MNAQTEQRPLSLPMGDMANRHPGLTPAVAASYVEAASVCLDTHHSSPADFQVATEANELIASVQWVKPDARCQAAWANETDRTEAGAYAVVLAASELAEGLVAIHRAHTRTGADYYVAPAGSKIDDLEDAFRLEVSGLDNGDRKQVAYRLQSKTEQAARGASNLPAMAGVVGFRAQLVMLKQVVK